MINITNILKRSWHILWSYRVLWIFGMLLALTTGVNNNNPRLDYNLPKSESPSIPDLRDAPQWMRDFAEWFEQNIEPLYTQPEEHITTYIVIGLVVLLFMLVIGSLMAFVRYPSETAVIRMVDEYERSGAKVGFRQAWRLGWSRRALRIWLIDLLLFLPAFLFLVVMLALGLVFYFSITATSPTLNAFGVIATIGIAFVVLLIFFSAWVFLSLLRNFFVRAAALDDLGAIESIRYGWAMFKGHWKSAGLMWLIMIGVAIAAGIVGAVMVILLIPAYLILLVPAALVAVFPGLIAFGIASVFASGPLTWIIGIIAALPFFFSILFAPLLLTGGWYKIYQSTVWTLTYREIKTLGSLANPNGVPGTGQPAGDELAGATPS